jgi:hypothetical protein
MYVSKKRYDGQEMREGGFEFVLRDGQETTIVPYDSGKQLGIIGNFVILLKAFFV